MLGPPREHILVLLDGQTPAGQRSCFSLCPSPLLRRRLCSWPRLARLYRVGSPESLHQLLGGAPRTHCVLSLAPRARRQKLYSFWTLVACEQRPCSTPVWRCCGDGRPPGLCTCRCRQCRGLRRMRNSNRRHGAGVEECAWRRSAMLLQLAKNWVLSRRVLQHG